MRIFLLEIGTLDRGGARPVPANIGSEEVHRKKYRALITPSLLLELASHAAMGVAVGLAFAFVVTHVTALGLATVIGRGLVPPTTLLMFIATCATTFGIGATLTGLVITLTESQDNNGVKK